MKSIDGRRANVAESVAREASMIKTIEELIESYGSYCFKEPRYRNVILDIVAQTLYGVAILDDFDHKGITMEQARENAKKLIQEQLCPSCSDDESNE